MIQSFGRDEGRNYMNLTQNGCKQVSLLLFISCRCMFAQYAKCATILDTTMNELIEYCEEASRKRKRNNFAECLIYYLCSVSVNIMLFGATQIDIHPLYVGI